MFYSDISVNEIANSVQSELHVAPAVYIGSIARIINSVEQLLYTEIIRELRKACVLATDFEISLGDITVGDDEAPVNTNDVFRVFDGTRELIRQSDDDAYIMNDRPSYTPKGQNTLKLSNTTADNLTIFYTVRPKLKSVVNGSIVPDTLHLPNAFSELIASRLRGEICKIMGDDNQAAKWLNDYNTYLEDFRGYIARQEI